MARAANRAPGSGTAPDEFDLRGDWPRGSRSGAPSDLNSSISGCCSGRGRRRGAPVHRAPDRPVGRRCPPRARRAPPARPRRARDRPRRGCSRSDPGVAAPLSTMSTNGCASTAASATASGAAPRRSATAASSAADRAVARRPLASASLTITPIPASWARASAAPGGPLVEVPGDLRGVEEVERDRARSSVSACVVPLVLSADARRRSRAARPARRAPRRSRARRCRASPSGSGRARAGRRGSRASPRAGGGRCRRRGT